MIEFLDAVDEFCLRNGVEYDLRHIRGYEPKPGKPESSALVARLFSKDSEGRYFADVFPIKKMKKELTADYDRRVFAALAKAMADLRRDRIRAIKAVEMKRLSAVRDAGRKRIEALTV